MARKESEISQSDLEVTGRDFESKLAAVDVQTGGGRRNVRTRAYSAELLTINVSAP